MSVTRSQAFGSLTLSVCASESIVEGLIMSFDKIEADAVYEMLSLIGRGGG